MQIHLIKRAAQASLAGGLIVAAALLLTGCTGGVMIGRDYVLLYGRIATDAKLAGIHVRSSPTTQEVLLDRAEANVKTDLVAGIAEGVTRGIVKP